MGRRARGVGFSGIVSLGDKLDVDFGDLLDYFALDRGTRAILLYVESINDARKFMSAARAAARVKPVVVIKSGRHAHGAQGRARRIPARSRARTRSTTPRSAAPACCACIDLDELFAAAETLGRVKPFPGNRLAILTNGGGLGVLAVDRLVDLGGTLAELSPATMRRARRGAAADLVARQPGRHHRRRRRRRATRAALERAAATIRTTTPCWS